MAENYIIRPGDCVSSLAFERGFLWETIWNHPDNADLKAKRRDPNILKEGDVLYIPDLRLKEEPRATDLRHRFKQKGAPAKLRLRILEDELEQPGPATPAPAPQGPDPQHFVGEDPVTNPPTEKDKPRAKVPYVLNIDGRLINGETDSDGRIECSIPPDAGSAILTLEPGTLKEMAIPLNLGGLDPLNEISGVKHRLANFGFDCGDVTDELTDAFAAALSAFQESMALPITGQPDGATLDKLKSEHGS